MFVKLWISFDFDNTLIRNPYWRLHLRPWLDQEAVYEGTDPQILWQQIHAASELLWKRGQWTESFDWPTIVMNLGMRSLPDPHLPEPRTVASLVMPGVETTLIALRSRFRLAIVTNGFYRFQNPFIRALGWNYLFDAIIGPDLVGTAKPDGAMLASLHPGLAHVGDRLTHDVLVAQRAFRRGILFGPPAKEVDRIDPLSPAAIIPDRHIMHFQQLPSVL